MRQTESTELPYDKKKELQVAFRLFLTDLHLPYFATLNFNKYLSTDAAYFCLRKFHRELDRTVLGKNFRKLPAEQRTFFIAMPEHLNSNFHYHMLLRAPEVDSSFYITHATSLCRKFFPSSSLDITNLISTDDVRRTSFYSCKDMTNQKNYENFVISTQFLSNKKNSASPTNTLQFE